MHLIDLKVNFMGSSAIVANSIPVGTGLVQLLNLNNQNKYHIFLETVLLNKERFTSL